MQFCQYCLRFSTTKTTLIDKHGDLGCLYVRDPVTLSYSPASFNGSMLLPLPPPGVGRGLSQAWGPTLWLGVQVLAPACSPQTTCSWGPGGSIPAHESPWMGWVGHRPRPLTSPSMPSCPALPAYTSVPAYKVPWTEGREGPGLFLTAWEAIGSLLPLFLLCTKNWKQQQ